MLSKLGRLLRGAWWLLDASRRAVLNLLLLLFLIALVWGLLKGGAPALQPKTALVLNLAGVVSEQQSGASRISLLRQVQGDDGIQRLRLRDLLAVLEAAATDSNISHAVLILDNFQGAGPASLHELAAALQRFKAAGKPVIAWGEHYDQRQYYLAAQATEVWLHPMGSVLVEGYGRPRSYYKELMDKVGVQAHVIRAGKFKNFNESYTATGPSKETQEAETLLYGTLWAQWTGAVEQARKQPAGSVMQAIDSLPDSLAAVNGDAARWALERQWIDALKTRDEMRTALVARGAVSSEDKNTFRQVSYADYLGRVKPAVGGDAVGVIVAEGVISDGRADAGSIGSQSTSELIRRARDDDKVKALVLRVNSPGGSAFASEVIRRELELTRKAGKPVVVSMGDLAASGGYWISLAADEVIADAGTLTGSIGVIAMLPSAKAAMAKLGVNTTGTTTTWLGAAYDPRSGLQPRLQQLIQTSVDHTYFQFTSQAAVARKTTREAVDAVAQGRVWTGADAKTRGLVDRLGSYGDALAAAAKLGKLPEKFRVQYFETEPGRLQLWLQRFGVQLGAETLPAGLHGTLVATGLLPPLAQQMANDLAWLGEMGASMASGSGNGSSNGSGNTGPTFAATVHCLCRAP
jgi:protease-4